ncbi:hypothetical protein Vadar_006027 [Vaccinium darrowii]|uniref:Uncharacterized protein n=1 Tax=Vaccinium darrowii TaxID=229202 RepID=A0ACB7YD62_9ERIC|nr:hypothetical protein Vadar_006027 [Vaccinium darrowii]
MYEVFHRVKNCRQGLRKWSKTKNFNAKKKITEIQAKLKDIGENNSPRMAGEVRQLETELGKAWEQEEAYWSQKYRKEWRIKGDCNTTFFQAAVAQRRNRNRISGIQRQNGLWTEDDKEVATEFEGYFQNIFQSEGVANEEEIISAIKARVDARMNRDLTSRFEHKTSFQNIGT